MSYSLPSTWIKPAALAQFLTPQVVIHYDILLTNIRSMANFANQHHVHLRPHLKTHKTAEIVELQLEHGAIGLTVAKISEAEILVNSKSFMEKKLSILIAYPAVGKVNLDRIVQLQKQATLVLMIDSLEQAVALNDYARTTNCSFSVLVKINTGLQRCGLEPEQRTVLSFIKELLQLTSLNIVGLMTHAGHAYGADSKEQLIEIGTYEGEIMVTLGEYIEQELGLTLPIISVGSTPSVRISGAIKGVTEIRPGNYVFNDKSQVTLGSATWNECALRVISRIVSHPASNRWIIDAGSKTLTLDQGAHGKAGVSGYGQVVGHPELHITRLSEEHGVLEGTPSTLLHLGEVLEIIPNHACPVVNLTDQLLVLEKGAEDKYTFTKWDVLARGKSV